MVKYENLLLIPHETFAHRVKLQKMSKSCGVALTSDWILATLEELNSSLGN